MVDLRALLARAEAVRQRTRLINDEAAELILTLHIQMLRSEWLRRSPNGRVVAAPWYDQADVHCLPALICDQEQARGLPELPTQAEAEQLPVRSCARERRPAGRALPSTVPQEGGSQLTTTDPSMLRALASRPENVGLMRVLLDCATEIETLRDRKPHRWGPSRVGHGNLQCTNCLITDLEADALDAWFCDQAPKAVFRSKNP